jgi:phosphatidylglycerophosphate synthase
VRAVQSGFVIGLIGLVALLSALSATVGLGPGGWAVGLVGGIVTTALLGLGLRRSDVGALGPADWVTLSRAVIACAIAAQVADSFWGSTGVPALVLLTVIALVLDGVDGWVARRTATESTFGARFDMEVDSFLLLALSVYVARATGAWVLAIGAARYLFVAAGWLLPWLRGSLPPRYWRKVVATTQGVVLTIAAAEVLPEALMNVVLVGSIGLLAESFGRDVWWLWRHRSAMPDQVAAPVRRPEVNVVDPARGRIRGVASGLLTVLAALLVWFALVAPNEISRLTPSAFLRIPLEGLLVIIVVLALPARARRPTAALVGLVLGLLTIVKVLDMGFFEALGRPFNLVTDWAYFGPAVEVLGDSVGQNRANMYAVGAGCLALALLILLPLAVLRLSRLVERHRPTSIRAITALGLAWLLSALVGAQIVPGAPIASISAASLALSQIDQVRDGLEDREAFAAELTVDRFRITPGENLLTELRGKDVVVLFVESYGRVAVEDSELSAEIKAVLDSGTSRLGAAGYSSRSAYLTSPTFGGISWLAHATLQSGLWIDNQQRYNDLAGSDRFTLSGAFHRAGWRTVGVVPSNDEDWPEGMSLYDFDKVYDSRNVGYAGPEFSYATMPDQYTLAAFRRLELATSNRGPLMAEIDLVSSHTPWVPLPRMVDWSRVGDGSVFDEMADAGESPDEVWPDADRVRAAYGRSIEYSLETVISFVETYQPKDLVLIVLGDHQPASIVSGSDASHDVPITIIADDPAVTDRIASWGWNDGLAPNSDAPVWMMDSFRDRFLTAFGPQPP